VYRASHAYTLAITGYHAVLCIHTHTVGTLVAHCVCMCPVQLILWCMDSLVR